jgi:hypothetical protein
MYIQLRSSALAAVDRGLAAPWPEHPNVSGAVVDIPAEGGHATVVALTDGTTSLYTSVGGGTLGAGTDAAVAEATRTLLSAVQGQLELFVSGDDGALPPSGTVRFHILTPSGPRRADVSEDSFWGQAPDPLIPVIAATQGVITRIREVKQP